MTKNVQKASFTADFAELKELFGPPPVLCSEDAKAYDAMLARILKSLKANDFIEQMLAKDLMDATWEMKRYARHKALAIECQYREQQEMEDDEEVEQLEECAQESEQTKPADKSAVEGAQIEQVEQAQAGAPTTQVERMLELASVEDTLLSDVDEILAVDELEYAAALESTINYYKRLDRLYSIAMARRNDVLQQLDFYRQGLGCHLRHVTDDIIEGECIEIKQEAPPITGPGDGAQ